jgi:hypothetical protein
LRNFGLFPCHEVSKAFPHVLFFSDWYLIGDSLFAALYFQRGLLAYGKRIESQRELTDIMPILPKEA